MLPELDATPATFTLYGGTALALRLGHRTSVDSVKLSDFKGKYVVLFFYPLDFTFGPSGFTGKIHNGKVLRRIFHRGCQFFPFL